MWKWKVILLVFFLIGPEKFPQQWQNVGNPLKPKIPSTTCSPCSRYDWVPSEGSSRRALRPCLELLCTNMLSDTARTWPSTLTVVDTTTCMETTHLHKPGSFLPNISLLTHLNDWPAESSRKNPDSVHSWGHSHQIVRGMAHLNNGLWASRGFRLKRDDWWD